ncbi:hypothetical protein DF3PA_70138 [Candidatus Defluviicoccus seviourii]|uniref:Uncharacterized protein n=1 Tax=Candidatus Defluviicoccus seviourii TaxID=2565273 RepID=A0A564WH64_9PROT|nr:hypothetical protein DF3PA_70138 [Candidatus Defluviicoccus seviourii]
MIFYVVYETETGLITKVGSCAEAEVALQASAASTVARAVDRLYPDDRYKIIEGFDLPQLKEDSE